MKTRRWLTVLAVLALVAAACGDDAADETTTTSPGQPGTTAPPPEEGCEPGEVDGNLNFYNWSQYIDPDLVSQFEDEYGTSVTETFYDSNETMLAQVQAGGAAYDLIVPSDYMVAIMATDGLLLPLDKDALTNVDNIDAKFTGLPFDPNGDFSVPYQWGTTGIGVNLEVVGEDFTPTWGLIFDPALSEEYSGRISMLNDPRESLGAALKYLGYSLNTTSIEELQEAANLISETKSRLAKFDSENFAEDLVNGEVDVSHGWNGGFFFTFDEADAWDSFAYVIPEEGGVVWVDNMAIPTTAEHVCTAHTFIDFLLDADNGAALTNWNYYASPNEASEPMIDPAILEDPAIYPSDETLANLEFIADTGDFEINYQDQFTRAKS